jgi:hypothetical protein
LGMLCHVLLQITDVDAVRSSGLGQPFIAVLAQVLPQKTATALGALTGKKKKIALLNLPASSSPSNYYDLSGLRVLLCSR